VGQVGEKAIGLMSISTEIDYKLLNQYFELATYDNLIKSELTAAISARYDKLRHDERIKKAESEAELKKLIQQERVKTLKVGQRIILQQFCQEK
jgi:phage I-like protein